MPTERWNNTTISAHDSFKFKHSGFNNVWACACVRLCVCVCVWACVGVVPSMCSHTIQGSHFQSLIPKAQLGIYSSKASLHSLCIFFVLSLPLPSVFFDPLIGWTTLFSASGLYASMAQSISFASIGPSSWNTLRLSDRAVNIGSAALPLL